MKTKWMICLGIGAILAGASNLVAQQSVFTKVKVRFNRSDKDLDRVTGSDLSVTDYVLEEPAKCPNLQTRDSRKDSD